MSRVAVLGIGAIGSRVAQNLLEANHEVFVYNRTAEKAIPLVNKGAVYLSTPREAAEHADIVISMVTDNDASRAIWLDPETGAALGLSKDAIAIESSTLTVGWTQELAAEIERRGVKFLDAPIVGSRPQANDKKLIYLVGGDASTLSLAQDVLYAAGAAIIHHVGPVSQGMAMKLAVNALFGIQIAALGEILGMLNKNGITPAKAMECLGELPIMSPSAKGASSLMLMHNHAPMFPINLVEKDFRYMTQTAETVAAATPASTAIHDIYAKAIAKGYGNDNITGVSQLFI
jgi:3-hydroxyisobutyrate dehydrogenase